MSKQRISSFNINQSDDMFSTKGFIKSMFITFIILCLVFCLAVFGAYLFYNYELGKKYKVTEKASIIRIEKGESTDKIAKKLVDLNLLTYPLILKVYLTLNTEEIIKAGVYKLPDEDLSLKEVVDIFQGGTYTRKLTFIEGWRVNEYRDYLEKEMGKDFADKFIKNKDVKEGYMYPDTYIIDADYLPENLVSTMRNTFDKKVGNSTLEKGSLKGLTKEEVVIMASILEREMNNSKDLPIVAGILIKRYKEGWPLQTDATIQYAIGKPSKWWPVLTGADIDNTESPYNSYKTKSLPPTPISNPSSIAINAVVNAEDSPYYFYITGNDGKTYYAKTIEEHNINVSTHLK